jgi:hypothetical protein
VLRCGYQGREGRFQAVQQALDARRSQDQAGASSIASSRRSSLLGSDTFRSTSLRVGRPALASSLHAKPDGPQTLAKFTVST